jgi:hypothetical protein
VKPPQDTSLPHRRIPPRGRPPRPPLSAVHVSPLPPLSLSPLSLSPAPVVLGPARDRTQTPRRTPTRLFEPTAEMPVGAAEAHFDVAESLVFAIPTAPAGWSTGRSRPTLELGVCQVGEPDGPLDLGRRSPHEKRRPVIVK